MDWLNAFDPGAPKSNTKQQSWNQLSHGAQGYQSSASSSAAAGPSAPRPPSSGRTTRTFDYSAYTGISTAARPRPPRPLTRIRAAPPSSALRSEDAQPNENETRAKPWEISAPPSIGMARSKKKARPSSIPTKPRDAQQRPPIPLPQRPRPYQHANVARPLPQRPPAEAPKGPLPKEQRQKLREQQQKQPQQQQHTRQRDKQPASQPPPKKPRLDSTPSSLNATNAISSEAAALRKQPEQSRPITIDDICPEIRVWPQHQRVECERMIANANLDEAPASAIESIRSQYAGIKTQEIQNARSHAASCLNKHRNYSDVLCLALRNRPASLLALLHIRAELYRCVPALMPFPTCPPATADRRYAANLVKRVRNAFLELLGLKLTDIDPSAFCATEQLLRPTQPVELKTADQLCDTSDIGHHALAVIENYIKTFGPRIFDLTSHNVEQWKRRKLPYNSIEATSGDRTNNNAIEDVNLDTQQLDAPQVDAPRLDALQVNAPQVGVPSTLPQLSAEDPEASGREATVADQVHTSLPPSPRIPQPALKADSLPSPAVSKGHGVLSPGLDATKTKPSVPSPSASPKLAQLSGVLSIVERTPEPAGGSGRQQSHEEILEEARQAEELARYLEQLSDTESFTSAAAGPRAIPAPLAQALHETSSAAATIGFSVKGAKLEEVDELIDESVPGITMSETTLQRPRNLDEGTDDDDEDDRPIAEMLDLTSLVRHPSSADSDPEEDMPLRDLLHRQSSATPLVRSARGRSEENSTWPSKPFEPKVPGLKQFRAFSGAPGMSIKYFVPVASAALEAQTSVRSRASVFDAAIAVSEYGRIATFAEERTNSLSELDPGLPRKMFQFQARDLEGKVKGEKTASPIDRVEDVSRLTSKVCGIASSTRKLLGLGNHNDYPSQVSLVTVDDTGRAHRTYHLDERPHAQGAASISHFPRTDPDNASSIDFATGGIDGIVNHWRWKARSTRAETFRLHTLHDAKPVIALEHLSSRSNMLASASIGTVIGYDLSALTLGFSWNTSDHIVHLQRTPDPKLMLGVLARRDYDQFRMFDITGRNGPISRPVISFGWLNDAEGKLSVGRGTFHPTRRAIFAHGAEDGHVRVWDMRNARDPLIDQRLGDEPIVQAIWASSQSGDDEDIMYVATTKGVRSISLLAP